MDNIYIKHGKKYIPIGFIGGLEVARDGIYMVKHKPGSRSMVNLGWAAEAYGLMKIGEIPFWDMARAASLEMYAEELGRLLVGDETKYMSVAEASRYMIGKLFKLAENEKENEGKDK